jgi:hypothetical protein
MCEKYLYGSEGGAGNDRPYPYPRPKKYREASLAERTGWFPCRRISRMHSERRRLRNHPVGTPAPKRHVISQRPAGIW